MNRLIYLSNKKLIYLIFFIIYSTDAAIVSTNSDRIWARLAWIGILILSFMFIPKARYANNDKTYLTAFSIGIVASMFANEGFDVNFIQRIVLIWFSVAIVTSIDYDRLMDISITWMKTACCRRIPCRSLRGSMKSQVATWSIFWQPATMIFHSPFPVSPVFA